MILLRIDTHCLWSVMCFICHNTSPGDKYHSNIKCMCGIQCCAHEFDWDDIKQPNPTGYIFKQEQLKCCHVPIYTFHSGNIINGKSETVFACCKYCKFVPHWMETSRSCDCGIICCDVCGCSTYSLCDCCSKKINDDTYNSPPPPHTLEMVD